jgi:hypothetical protein
LPGGGERDQLIEEMFFAVPAESAVSAEGNIGNAEFQTAKNSKSTSVGGEKPANSGFVLSEAMPVKRTIQKRSSATVGAAQKDEGRALGVKFQAMKPVQWAGIALCAASIAEFYFGWPTIGFLSLAVGGRMVVAAAVLPGHELLILAIGGIGLAIAAVQVVYAYRTGHLHANGSGLGVERTS